MKIVDISKILYPVFLIGLILSGVLLVYMLLFGQSVTVSNLEVTNITEASASVIWTTDKPSVGKVVGKDGIKYFDDRDVMEVNSGKWEVKKEGEQKRYTHHVTLHNLAPEQEYNFSIQNDFGIYKEENIKFLTSTAAEKMTTPDPVYGKALSPAGLELQDGIVTMVLKTYDGKTSQKISSVLSSGTYAFDTSGLFVEDFSGRLKVGEFDTEIIKVYATVVNGVIEGNLNVAADKDQPVGVMRLTYSDKNIESIGTASGLIQQVYANPDDNCCGEPDWGSCDLNEVIGSGLNPGLEGKLDRGGDPQAATEGLFNAGWKACKNRECGICRIKAKDKMDYCDPECISNQNACTGDAGMKCGNDCKLHEVCDECGGPPCSVGDGGGTFDAKAIEIKDYYKCENREKEETFCGHEDDRPKDLFHCVRSDGFGEILETCNNGCDKDKGECIAETTQEGEVSTTDCEEKTSQGVCPGVEVAEVALGTGTGSTALYLDNSFIQEVYAQGATIKEGKKDVGGAKLDDYSGDIVLESGTYEVVGMNVTTKSFEFIREGVVKLYYDLNSNGKKDYNEDYIESPNLDELNIKFNKTAEITEYKINIGWNLVSFPMDLGSEDTSKILQASDLYANMIEQGVEVTQIATYREGKFLIYSNRQDLNAKQYGDDFTILPGEGYFIKSMTNLSFSVKGKLVDGPLEIMLNSGWNLVGLYHSGMKNYKGFSVLSQMKDQGITARVLTKWENGQYYNLVSDNDTEFGMDYNVYPLSGYWIQNTGELKKFTPNASGGETKATETSATVTTESTEDGGEKVTGNSVCSKNGVYCDSTNLIYCSGKETGEAPIFTADCMTLEATCNEGRKKCQSSNAGADGLNNKRNCEYRYTCTIGDDTGIALYSYNIEDSRDCRNGGGAREGALKLLLSSIKTSSKVDCILDETYSVGSE